jgi:hypothetical protein
MRAPSFPTWTLLIALLLLAARSAGGQTHACTASAGVPPTVNVERITALTTDLVVTCTGSTPTPAGTPVPVANIQIFANTNVDEYEFVVHPRVVGHGPTLFAGLSKSVDLKLVSTLELGSAAVAMRYEPRK